MAAKAKNKVAKKEDSEVPVEREIPARALSPFEEMDRMFDGFFPHRWMQPFRWEMPQWPELSDLKVPKVDIIDRDTEIVVKAELPGVEKDDIDVSMTDNSVTIKGSTSHEEKEEKGNYYRSEITRGSFSRTVALPSDVDADKARAAFNDGILELTIPKVEKSHRKNITVE
ncbi:MAG: Hsp20/alpha crystallin family protein [Pseudomonadota bacterium]